MTCKYENYAKREVKKIGDSGTLQRLLHLQQQSQY